MRSPVFYSSGSLRAMVCYLVLAPAGWAQFPAAKSSSVRGQIEEARVGEPLQVELRGNGHDQLSRKALVGPTGDFEFDSLPMGNYQLRVTDFRGSVLHEEFVSIDDGCGFLSVRLPKPKGQQPVSGVASVRELQQKIPSKALREFSHARQELDKRALQKSIASLQRATALYPGYAEAHNLLGVCYIALKQFDQAAAAFRKAAEIAPGAPMPRHNLSVALYSLGDYAEAEKAARLALKLNPNLAATHFLLAMSLHAQEHDGEETLGNLRWAARQIPKARLTAAAILANSGRQREAANELRAYLRTSEDPGSRRDVESWLASLPEQTPPQPHADARGSGPDPLSAPGGSAEAGIVAAPDAPKPRN